MDKLKLKAVPVNVKEFVKQVAAELHPHIKMDRVLVVFSIKTIMNKGRKCLATMSVASAPVNIALADGAGIASEDDGLERQVDFILTIHEKSWREMETPFRRALIDHELHHAEYNDEGNPKTVGHDFEDFVDVVARHGLWTPALAAVKQSMTEEESNDG